MEPDQVLLAFLADRQVRFRDSRSPAPWSNRGLPGMNRHCLNSSAPRTSSCRETPWPWVVCEMTSSALRCSVISAHCKRSSQEITLVRSALVRLRLGISGHGNYREKWHRPKQAGLRKQLKPFLKQLVA